MNKRKFNYSFDIQNNSLLTFHNLSKHFDPSNSELDLRRKKMNKI